MKKLTWLCVIFCFLGVSLLYADTGLNYQEMYIHNASVEERLQEWVDRTIDHSLDLETSDHAHIREWRRQMDSLDLTKETASLQRLNALINGDVQYVDDYTHFHRKDFWADPFTVLEEGGDCEDIALLKAASLHRLRWPPERMHLLVGFLTERGKAESHAVLLVEKATGEQVILRSITNQVVSPDKFAFTPIYAVDGHGTIIVKPPVRN